MVTREIYKQLVEIIAHNSESEPKFEADQLIEFVTGRKRLDVMDTELNAEQAEKLFACAKRRREGYPLQYIIGVWQFFDMELKVGEGVLVPRQDTETVCEAAFEILENMENPQVADLCSGSGCIALAIKKYCPKATVTAVEKSPQAYEYLKRNIEFTGLSINPVMEDVFLFDKALQAESLDLIISNPPYIDPAVKQTLQTEVGFEPEMALFAEDNGLEFYKYIAQNYHKALKEGGYLVFEYGYDQQQAVREILLKEGYSVVKEITDLGGNPRGVAAKK